ncbi:MAG: HD domain-containing protein [Alkaliphilus sp.]
MNKYKEKVGRAMIIDKCEESRVALVEKYVCRKIGEKCFEKDKGKKKGYRFFHSKLVGNIMMMILESCSNEDISENERKKLLEQKEMLLIAALIHDVKKDEKKHALAAGEIAEDLDDIMTEYAAETNKTSWKYFEEKEVLIIKEMIEKHGKESFVYGEEDQYIKLIQDADKLSKYWEQMNCKDICAPLLITTDDTKKFYNKKDKVRKEHEVLHYRYSKNLIEQIKSRQI